MKLVQETRATSELTIVGDGPLRPALEALAGALKLRCRFTGAQPIEMIHRALCQARVFCLPSVTAANGDSEGLPTVIVEAQAMGIPVVSTMHAGIPEIISNEQNGILTPERDHRALSSALSRILEDRELWERFHLAALRRIDKHFNLNTQTAKLEEIYSELLGA
jgi:glycosyltransferase involved in cell wall biosynthesis